MCFIFRVGTDTHALLESSNGNFVSQINGDNDDKHQDYGNGFQSTLQCTLAE